MYDDDYSLDDFDFSLPDELIAQHPAARRDDARLMVLDRATDQRTHSVFSKLHRFLLPGDILVFNDARVMNARVPCRRETGGAVELMLLERISARQWKAIATRTKKLKPGTRLFPISGRDIEFFVVQREDSSIVIESNVILDREILDDIGQVPLPPYIERDADKVDADRYQTVYARADGAVAAPTAGLHFTRKLITDIAEKGIEMTHLTLIVSWGTFQPVRSARIAEHRMHAERYHMSEETAEAVNRARTEKRRVIAVGTTSLRVLESTFGSGANQAGEGETDLFIYPPKKVRSIDALITNFHTPRSTLLMLVSAFAGHERILSAYHEAIAHRYRFFSYGDAMFIT
jgi:S-adenosylmethionine:tRNA ribosyltransferase-isomerase